jgi:ParB family chromosome partitioning protein
MQDSSAFQFVAINLIFESTTNPRKTFDPAKLEELAASVREHGIIQPLVLRPKNNAFEVVAGARRFRAAQLAEKFSVPAHVKELTDAQAMEWQLIENSQRVDVHPYEEALGFQNLLDMPGYDVAALVEKTGKSASHIYARLSLLNLVSDVAQAFVEERITASHANLIARLPAEHQPTAFENCWRKDWRDAEPHLLPAKHLSAWIETNLYLALDAAPFDREDATLFAEAGACVTCPKRSGYNTSLFPEVNDDQCLDGVCYQAKTTHHIDRVISENPHLVQIETSWRPPKEQRPGVLSKNTYRVLEEPENPDADPICPSTKTAMVVFGKEAGTLVPICTNGECPVHNPHIAARIAREMRDTEEDTADPVEEVEPRTEEGADSGESEDQTAEREAERTRQAAARKEALERQQREYEAEVQRQKEVREVRLRTLEQIVARAPIHFDASQLRLFVELLLGLSPYGLFEEVAEHFGQAEEDRSKIDDEILKDALAACADDKLMGFILRLLLTTYVDPPPGEQVDWLDKAATAFLPPPSPAKKKAKKAAAVPRKTTAKTVRKKAA